MKRARYFHDAEAAELISEANDQVTSYERLCEIFNEMYHPSLKLDPAHPICAISPAADELASAAFRKGCASGPAHSPYPPEQAQIDLEAAHEEVKFLKRLINMSVSRTLSGSLRDAQSFSALTLKAALAGAFTPPKENG